METYFKKDILQIAIPYFYGYDNVGPEYSYVLEKINGEVLSDLYVNSSHNLDTQLDILDKSLFVLSELKKLNPVSIHGKKCIQLATQEYIYKTKARLKQYDRFEELKNIDLEVNNKRISSFEILWIKAVELIRSLAIDSKKYFSVFHGDLNYSNIFDADKITVIDPKGGFGGEASIFGDYRYDIAKIRQSYHSGYFQLLYGKYKKIIEPGYFKIYIFDYPSQVIIDNLDCRLVDYGVDLLEIQLLESLLLLSLISLHKEDKNFQLIMYIIGTQMLYKTLNREIYKLDTELVVRWPNERIFSNRF